MVGVKSQVKFIDLEPSAELRIELDEAYERVMASGRYINGPETKAFEQEWATYCLSEYCVSCASGQDALELLLKAHNIGPGDTVIVPSWTASATWKAVLAIGARPRPVEVNLGDFLAKSEKIILWMQSIYQFRFTSD